MAKYYNWRHTSALVFYSGYKVYLDFSDIYITHSLAKLSHHCLRPYKIEKQVGLMLYCLKLFSILWRLYLIFPVVKLTTTSDNPISGRYSSFSLDLIIINEKEE